MHPYRRRALILAAAAVVSISAVVAASPADAGESSYPDLAAAYDNTGILPDAAPRAAGLDGSGRALPAQALARAGWDRGDQVRLNGITFAWPAGAPGRPDNTIAAGQRISLTGAGRALAFLAAATNPAGSPFTGTGTVTYTDGSGQTYALTVPDWRSHGTGAALTLPYVSGPTGPEYGSTPRLFVREIPLQPGKRLRSVTLPGPSAGPGALHVFALGVRPESGAWRGTWSTAQHTGYPVADRADMTVRMPVRTTVAGSKARIRLTNAFSLSPVRFGAATVALRGAGAALVPGTAHVVTFDGRPEVTIPAGGEMVSDPVEMTVPAQSDLVVSLYLAGKLTHVSQHGLGLQTVYWTAPGAGDRSRDIDGASFSTVASSWPFLSGVDVTAERGAHWSVAVLGDSITDGTGSTPDANRRWTDHLATRLDGRAGVLNVGITGNRLTGGSVGNEAALERLDRDVLSQAGVRTVILFAGVNDVRAGASDEEVTEALTELAARARAAGVRVVGGTVIPFRGWMDGRPGGWTPEKESVRLLINAFVRDSGGVFDAVADFDAALRDPAQPDRYNPLLDSGDHLHPNDAGMVVLADAVDPETLGLSRR